MKTFEFITLKAEKITAPKTILRMGSGAMVTLEKGDVALFDTKGKFVGAFQAENKQKPRANSKYVVLNGFRYRLSWFAASVVNPNRNLP